MQQDIISYHGWDQCVHLSNGVIDCIVLTDVGPRIIWFGFTGEQNELCEFPDQAGQKGGSEWRSYGGHRLWHAPEAKPRTYLPDNEPIHFEGSDGYLKLTQKVESETGIRKEMEICMLPANHLNGSCLQVTHRLHNQGLWPVELAPWAVTVLAAGGTAILPLPPRQLHSLNFSADSTLTLWAYTDFSDPRWIFTPDAVLLKQNASIPLPQKFGAPVKQGWGAFARGGHLFVKTVRYQPGAVYPDGGSTFEVFTNSEMTELETLGPLTCLQPGEQVEHIETWHLLRDIPEPANGEDVARHIFPAVNSLI